MSCPTAGEKERVDVWYSSNCIDNHRAQKSHTRDVAIVDCDKVEATLGEKLWYIGFDAGPDRFERRIHDAMKVDLDSLEPQAANLG